MTKIAAVQDVVKKLRADMPVRLTIHDPISGAEFTIERENMLAHLVVDVNDVLADAQTVAMFYAECARAQRACERAAATGEREFVAWKAYVSGEARRKSGDKKITVAETEDAYRTHKDYQTKAGVQTYYTALAGLFEDLKMAFSIKSRMIDAVMRGMSAADRAHRVETKGSESLSGDHGSPR